jgi:phage anti-repressor protein
MEVTNRSQQLFLVAGATGKIGINVVKALIAKNRKVRILIQDETKLDNFTEEERSKIETITICNLFTDSKYEEKIEAALNLNNKNVTHIISCLSFNEKNKSYDSYFISQTRLIEAAKKHNVEKFLLISSTHVTKPYSSHSLLLNLSHQYTQWNRVRVEEYLRKSSVKYLIVRPGQLIEGNEAHDFSINQGDILNGKINVQTLGRLAVDTFLDPWIPENVTYECITDEKQNKEKYSYVQGRFRLYEDSEKDDKKCNSVAHVRACRLVEFSFFFILSTAAFSVAYHLNEQFRKWVKDNISSKLLK